MTGSLSAYDAAVPHPAADAGLAARFASLRDLRVPVDLDLAREIVLLVSSSRGGSSMLTEILRRVDGVLSLPGEVNAHVVIAQLAGGDRDVFREELARDVGRPVCDGEIDPSELTADVCWRLAAQWPRLPIDTERAARAVTQAMESVGADHTVAFTRAVLHRVGTDLHPAAYDIGDDGEPPPPSEPVVEMTPYVGFRAWRRATPDELRSQPLVIATPRNAYRLEWLAELFPAACVRVLHLTRNPAASVNGLIDGWRSPWFFNVRARERWWKYDVPPRWQQLAEANLAQVAAEQWRSAHQAVLDTVTGTGMETLRLRYEDVVGEPARREAAAVALAGFLGVDAGVMRAAVLAGVPPVMATAPPQRRRWSGSDNDLAPALAEPAIWETAAALGYEVEERLWI
jgi:hypothetical protein